ncbi:MAG: hypothetical protein HY320_05215 [Armatimonadetes bacterium]|nr:hypothetical protein [Armatimonadota bacterium]
MRSHWASMLLGIVIATGAGALTAERLVAADVNSTNGIYGGYVGSDKWFAEMRNTAANQALMRSLTGRRDTRRLPADYVEFAGQIVFPEGNPFPKKRLPDLRIKCRNEKADSVERAPFVDKDGGFYTAFKRGQSYDLYWMYYFGSREKFGSIVIPAKGPARRRGVFEYRVKGVVHREDPRPAGEDKAPGGTTTAKPAEIPANVDVFDLSGFPPQPTDFEEQLVLDAIQSATTPALKAEAHEKLARYYEKKGDTERARSERAKAEYWSTVQE